MVKLGAIIVMGAIGASIFTAMFVYMEFQTNFVLANAGEPIQIGPVVYVIEPAGVHSGNEKTQPEHTFLKIRITAENRGNEQTRISGGQFYLVEENDEKQQPVFGEFSSEDLLYEFIEPGEQGSWTTQFDIAYDENKQYRIGIVPSKQQASKDIGIVCILNC